MSRFIHEVIYKPLKHNLESLDKDQEGQILVTGLNTDLLISILSTKIFYPDFEAISSVTSASLILSPGVMVQLKGGDRLGYSSKPV